MTTIGEIARGLPGVRVLRGHDIAVRRVRIDSRRVEPGDLFVALRGPRFNAAHAARGFEHAAMHGDVARRL